MLQLHETFVKKVSAFISKTLPSIKVVCLQPVCFVHLHWTRQVCLSRAEKIQRPVALQCGTNEVFCRSCHPCKQRSCSFKQAATASPRWLPRKQ